MFNREDVLKIPFNKPFIVGKELYYIAQSVLSGQISGNGLFTKKCQTLMEERFGAKKILLTTSCTAALEMAAILSNVGPGDQVILPSFTFVSTANAFYLRGAKLTFVDISPDTMTIDVEKTVDAINEHTKVIVPVHYAGISTDMDSIMNAAKKNNLLVIEDSAQGVNAKYKGKYLGTIGDFGVFSFHETKNYICGEGGAIVLNNEKYINRAEIIWEKGTDRCKFFRGEVDKYTWVDVGSSFLPSDILAAFLYAQLENMEEINQRRKEIYNLYFYELSVLADEGMVQLPIIPKECEPNYHMFYIILPNKEIKGNLIQYLQSNGILAIFHYLPLHLSDVGRTMGYSEGDLPVTESISNRLIRLPFYYSLQKDDQMAVIKAINTGNNTRASIKY
jgi:dTDP-4-amino-4,6-dideoxygalactose transaminase